jgi:MoxR-like ATPase
MNGYALTAEIIKAIASLAWPVSFVGAVWLFREKLIELLPNLRVKHKDWEVSFRLNEAEKEAESLPPVAPEALPTPEEKNRFDQIAKISPRAAILEYRAQLEQAVRDFAQSVGMVESRRPFADLVRELRKHALIDSPTSAILDDLRTVGNSAAHRADNEFSLDEALRFRALAERVINQFRITTAAAKATFGTAVLPS